MKLLPPKTSHYRFVLHLTNAVSSVASAFAGFALHPRILSLLMLFLKEYQSSPLRHFSWTKSNCKKSSVNRRQMSPSHYNSQVTSEISWQGFQCNPCTAVDMMNAMSAVCYQYVSPLPYRANYREKKKKTNTFGLLPVSSWRDFCTGLGAERRLRVISVKSLL